MGTNRWLQDIAEMLLMSLPQYLAHTLYGREKTDLALGATQGRHLQRQRCEG